MDGLLEEIERGYALVRLAMAALMPHSRALRRYGLRRARQRALLSVQRPPARAKKKRDSG